MRNKRMLISLFQKATGPIPAAQAAIGRRAERSSARQALPAGAAGIGPDAF